MKVLLEHYILHLFELKLSELDKKYVWHPYTQMKDWKKWNNKVIVSSEEFYLVDTEGKKYLDGIASMWCNVWGHGKREILNKMTEQLQDIPHSTLFGLANGPSIELAERLLKLAKGMDNVFYSDNGSSAVEVAMKMALQYWRNKGHMKKRGFIALEHGYHGDTFGAMSVGYIDEFFRAYKPLLTKVYRVPSPCQKEIQLEDIDDSVDLCLSRTEDVLRKYSSQCSALVMESGAQIAGGAIIYPDGYQRKISELCRRYNVLLILDEIATGFGRLGNMIEYLDQRSIPDIVCYGKALTAGYSPLAVTMTTKKIYNAFLGIYSENKQFYHGHTFTGHPVGCAAAITNIDLYKKYDLIKHIKENSNYLHKRLSEFQKSSLVCCMRHKGFLAAFDLKRNGKPIKRMRNKDTINYFIMRESLRMGIFLRSLGNVMMVIPPLAICRKDLKMLLDAQLRLLGKIESFA